jgi:molybdenum cofactor cytidylyltransferase
MNRISAVLLAAGESRRMGEINKLEMNVDGVSLLRHTVNTLLASQLQELVVVLGYQVDKVRFLLEGLPVKIVLNDIYHEGQMTSVHRGLESLSQSCDGVMICLSDQPLIQSSDINIIIDAFEKQNQESILVPTHQGKRGNPIILSHKYKDLILNGQRNLGCKRVIKKNPDEVTTIEMDTNHVIVDIDTPQDYATFQQSL